MKKLIKTTLFIALLMFNKNIIKAANYIWPIDEKNAYETYIEYGYGQRTYDSKAYDLKYPGGQLEGYYSRNENHYGVDITGIKGHTYDVISIVDGTVLTTSLDQLYNPSLSYIDRNQRNASFDGGGYGNYIVIKEDSTGRCFLYAHLKANSVTLRNGNKVKKGQKIAVMGSSGDSGHMHLHFEVRLNQNTTTTGKNLVITRTYGVETLNPIDYIGSKAPEKKIEVIEQIVPEKAEAKQEVKETKKVETKQEVIVNTKAKVTNVNFENYRDFGKLTITLDKEASIPTIKVTIGSEEKTANFIAKDGNKYIFTIVYNQFDITTYGYINIKVISNEIVSFEKYVGRLDEYKIKETYEETYYYKQGDVNKDGRVDAVDASQVLSLYSKLITEKPLTADEKDQLTRADMNNDGYVNSIDASMILNYYANVSTTWTPSRQEKIIACDITGDKVVNMMDYQILKNMINSNVYAQKYDLNRDNKVDSNDEIFFKSVLKDYGTR